MERIYITRPIFPEVLRTLQERFVVDMNPDDRVLSRAELIDRSGSTTGLLSFLTDTVDADVLKAAPNLRVVANFAVGFNNIDVSTATRLGIAVTNTPGVLTESTADFTWALLMAVSRRVCEGDRFVREGRFDAWGPQMLLGHDVFGKTLGLIGLGRIGRAVARRAQGFRMKVLYNGPDAIPDDIVRELGVERVDIQEMFRRSDFISIHVPLLPSTKHLLDDEAFQLMKPNCIVINTSRGPVVNEQALVRALAARKIAGAGLDVYEREPQIEPELLRMDNVVLAPHIASASWDTRMKMCSMAADNLTAVLEGIRPPNLVNPDVWDSRRR